MQKHSTISLLFQGSANGRHERIWRSTKGYVTNSNLLAEMMREWLTVGKSGTIVRLNARNAAAIRSDATIRRSVIGRNVHSEDGAEINEGVILDGVRIGSKARLRQVIADRYNAIPESAETEFEPEEDRKEYQTIQSGPVILPRGLSGGKSGFTVPVCS